MSHRHTISRMARSDSPSPPSDPWRAAIPPTPNESGSSWLLSYLDVMTILFAFFVLLFAYQKALTPSQAKSAKPPAVAQHRSQQLPVAAKRVEPSHPADAPNATQAAVTAMKSQISFKNTHDVITGTAPAGGNGNAAKLTEHALAGATQLASEQTARLIAHALEKEPAQRDIEIVQEGRNVRVEVSEAILFDPGSAELRPEGLALLDRLLPALSERKDPLFVEGHTDSSAIANARFPSNWELSSARATAVTRYLIARGLPGERLRPVGLADTRPRADNASPEGRARNRRVSLVMGN